MADKAVLNAIYRRAARVADPGKRQRYLKAALETGIVESGLRNLNYGDADSKGWRQERASLYRNPTNVTASVDRFFNELAQFDRGQSPGELAAAVQRPAAQYRGRYAQVAGQAEALMRGGGGAPSGGASGGGTSGGDSTTVTTRTPGTDNSSARAQLVMSFLSQKGADPVSFATGMRGLRDTPATSSTHTIGGGGPQAPQSPTGGAHPSGVHGPLPFEGKQVAAWIQPILKFAREQGWKGSINSGYRSTAEQARIYNSGVRPAARPGTSNHEFTAFPGGAIDVSDAAQLSNILRRSKYANLLIWAGAKDPVHFSHPHGGSY